MKKTRHQVFETNSSSVHTLVIKASDSYKVELERVQENPNIVVGHCMDYSKVGHTEPYLITTQQEKFNYIVTWLVVRSQYTYEPLEESWIYANVLAALNKVDPAIEAIKPMEEDLADFDHQTAPHSESDSVIDMWDEDAICEFIFNDNITLKCTFD